MKTKEQNQNYSLFFEEFKFSTSVDKRKLAIDIVNVMSEVYYADISIERQVPRIINLEVPVYFIDKWRNTKDTLKSLLNWISEERYEIEFVKNYNLEGTEDIHLDFGNNIDTVTLFSGGLDSFAGAYNNEKLSINSDYIGFINKYEEGTKQKGIRSRLYNAVFPNSSIYLINSHPVSKKVFTQSTRSLLYLSLAVAKSLTEEKYKSVYIYENGILGLNPELMGRYTTKTTHPKTIYLFNKVLRNIGISVDVKNPFIFNTKGQIFADLSSKFKNEIKNTFTCGQSRVNPTRNHKGHCGVCIPCILRKISLAANSLEDYDVIYQYPYEVKLNDISEEVYRKDYQSNLDYFAEYVALIKSKEIFPNLEISDEFYDDEQYLLKTKQMFEVFVEEFERFWSLYAPY